MTSANVIVEAVQWIISNWGFVASFLVAVGFVFRIYHNHLEDRKLTEARFKEHHEKIRSYQNTTETTISAIQSARQESRREIERKMIERGEKLELEIKNAKLHARNELLEYKKEADKKIEEHGKLIHQLLLNQTETNSLLKNQNSTLEKMEKAQMESHRETVEFRKEFYLNQPRK